MSTRTALFLLTILCLSSGAARAFDHSTVSLRELAEYYAGKGNRPAALATYDKALAARPNDPLIYQSRGFYYLAQRDPQRALADFNHQIRLTPRNPAGYLNRAMLLDEMGRKDEASADFSKACRLGSDDGCMMGGTGSPARR